MRDKEKAKLYQAEYQQKNKEAIFNKRVEYRAKNKDEIREKRRLYRVRNKQKLIDIAAKYYADNKPTISGKARAKRESHPEFALLARAKSRARLAGVPFAISVEDIEIPEECPLLGIQMCVAEIGVTDSSYSLDRIVPELGYVRGNVIVISHLANRMKNSADMDTFLRFCRNSLKLFGEKSSD